MRFEMLSTYTVIHDLNYLLPRINGFQRSHSYILLPGCSRANIFWRLKPIRMKMLHSIVNCYLRCYGGKTYEALKFSGKFRLAKYHNNVRTVMFFSNYIKCNWYSCINKLYHYVYWHLKMLYFSVKALLIKAVKNCQNIKMTTLKSFFQVYDWWTIYQSHFIVQRYINVRYKFI